VLRVPDTVARGDAVPLRLVLHNPHTDTIQTITRAPIAHDFVVRDEQGRVVWRRWADDIGWPDVAATRVLPPGAVLELHAVWDGRDRRGRAVPAGRYRVEAVLEFEALAEPRWLVVR
jgi:hypothetical protein